MAVPTDPLTGDALLDAVNEAMIALHRRYYHRAPGSARTQLLDDEILACVMGGVYTDVEKTLIELQRNIAVKDARGAFHTAMKDKFIAEVERLSGRRVDTFISDNHVGPDWRGPCGRVDGSLSLFQSRWICRRSRLSVRVGSEGGPLNRAGADVERDRKYRKFTAQQKSEIVLASLRGPKTMAELCRVHASPTVCSGSGGSSCSPPASSACRARPSARRR